MGAVFLVAACRNRRVIRLSPNVQHMNGLMHMLAAVLFMGMPIMFNCRRLTWPVAGVFFALSVVAVVYGLVIDQRVRGREREG